MMSRPGVGKRPPNPKTKKTLRGNVEGALWLGQSEPFPNLSLIQPRLETISVTTVDLIQLLLPGGSDITYF